MRGSLQGTAGVTLLIAAVSAGVAWEAAKGLEAEPAAAIPATIPDTPVGRRLDWVIGEINADRLPHPNEVRGQFSPERFGDMAITVRILGLLHEALAPVSLMGFRGPAEDRHLAALLRDRSGEEHRLELWTDPYSGDRIVGWWLGPAATIGPEQVGLTAWDPSRHGPMPGAEIELLNGETGEPLDPPEQCIANFFGFCRLMLPAALESAAVRLSHRLLFSQLETIHYHPAGVLRGKDYWAFSAFPRAWLIGNREAAASRSDSPRGALGGTVVYFGAEDRKYLGRAGCATVELTPSRARVFYYSHDPWRLDSERTFTDSQEAAWFVPELQSGAQLATARVGDRSGSLRLPRVAPGGFHFLFIPIFLSDEDRKAELPRCD